MDTPKSNSYKEERPSTQRRELKLNMCGNWNSEQCKIEMPWLFQSLAVVGTSLANMGKSFFPKQDTKTTPIQNLTNSFFSKSNQSSLATKGPSSKAQYPKNTQLDPQVCSLAVALSTNKEGTLIEFYSPKCRLCASLVKTIHQIHQDNDELLNVVMADVDSKSWLPEVLHYDIKYVPCFVLLDKNGTALAKTAFPVSRYHVLSGLSHLLQRIATLKNLVKDKK